MTDPLETTVTPKNVPSDPETGNLLTAWFAEYESLRSEMAWLISDGAKYQTLAFGLIAAVLAGVGGMVEVTKPELIVPTLLVAAFFLILFGYLFSRQHAEVYVIATNLKTKLRRRLRNLLNERDLWGWEEFKRDNLRYAKAVPFLRTCLFILPAVVCLVAVAVIMLSSEQCSPSSPVGERVVWIVFVVAHVMLLLLGFYVRDSVARVDQMELLEKDGAVQKQSDTD